ncbi:MAG: hypothetical protein ACOH2H_24645 [Cypionkella sp.]
MKSILLAMPLVFAAGLAFAGALPVTTTTTTTKTDPTLFLGLSWTFGQGSSSAGGSSGVTLKVLSTNKRNAGAFAAGVTYNFDRTIGCDLGVAYSGSGIETLTLGYDLCKRAPQISVGASGKPKTTTTTTVITPPA